MESFYKDCDMIVSNNRAYFRLTNADYTNYTQKLINKVAIEQSILPKLFAKREINEEFEENLDRLRRISQTDAENLEAFCVMPEFVDLLTWLISLNGTEHTDLSVLATIIMTNALFVYNEPIKFRSETLIEHIFFVLQKDSNDYKEYVTNLILNYLSAETYKELIDQNIIEILLQFFNINLSSNSIIHSRGLSYLIFNSLFQLMNEDQHHLLFPTFNFIPSDFLSRYVYIRLNSTRYLNVIIRNEKIFNFLVQDPSFFKYVAYSGNGFGIMTQTTCDIVCDIYIYFIQKGYTCFEGCFKPAIDAQYSFNIVRFDRILEFLYYAVPYNLSEFEEHKLYDFALKKFNNGNVAEKQAASKVLVQYMCLHSQEIDLQIGETFLPKLAEILEDIHIESLYDILKLLLTIFERGEKFIQLGINSNIPESVLELTNNIEIDDKISEICNRILQIFNIDTSVTF